MNMPNSRIKRIFNHMHGRCYNEQALGYKSYGGKGITICDEWHDYDNFKKWYEDNYYRVGNEQMVIDKDIKFKGNTEYSPEACMIIPISINNVFVRNTDRELPTGVVGTPNGKFNVRLNTPIGDKEYMYLGTYPTVEKAKRVYDTHKTVEVLKLIRNYDKKIPKKIYNQLMKFELGC